MFQTSPTMEIVAQALDICALRQAAYAANLANRNVEGYRRLEVQFEDQLARALSSPGGTPPAGLKPEVRETKGLAERVDGNNVDMDREVGELQRTAMLFQTYTQLLQTRMGMLRRAMDGR